VLAAAATRGDDRRALGRVGGVPRPCWSRSTMRRPTKVVEGVQLRSQSAAERAPGLHGVLGSCQPHWSGLTITLLLAVEAT
jgi:hypothetical protein